MQSKMHESVGIMVGVVAVRKWIRWIRMQSGMHGSVGVVVAMVGEVGGWRRPGSAKTP
jgi:hypothetical protein